MPRLPLVPDDPTDASLAPVYARIRGAGSPISNLYRTLAHAPKVLDAWLEFGWRLRTDLASDRGLRELVIVRTAQLNETEYQWYPHWTMAIAAGVAEDKLVALANWEASTVYSVPERAALAMADELAGTTRLSDATWHALRAVFDELTIVELVMTASWYSCVSRVAGALAVQVDEPRGDAPPISGALPTRTAPAAHAEPGC